MSPTTNSSSPSGSCSASYQSPATRSPGLAGRQRTATSTPAAAIRQTPFDMMARCSCSAYSCSRAARSSLSASRPLASASAPRIWSSNSTAPESAGGESAIGESAGGPADSGTGADPAPETHVSGRWSPPLVATVPPLLHCPLLAQHFQARYHYTVRIRLLTERYI